MPQLVFLLIGLFALSLTEAQSANVPSTSSAWTGESPTKETAPEPKPAPPAPTPKKTPPPPIPAAPPVTNSILPLTPPAPTASVATLAVTDLREYEFQPPAIRRLLTSALALTTLNLSYQYGSSDPKNGGMDCSGTIYYLLNATGLKDVPRDASGQYIWVWTRSHFEAVVSSNPNTFELSRLKPGDLLFWTGTYKVDHDPPVTHVMIYLGINRHSGHRVMVGASEGRVFEGKSRYGVSVFDFTLPGKHQPSAPGAPAPELQSRFVGYGPIPGLADASETAGPGK